MAGVFTYSCMLHPGGTWERPSLQGGWSSLPEPKCHSPRFLFTASMSQVDLPEHQRVKSTLSGACKSPGPTTQERKEAEIIGTKSVKKNDL